MRVFKLKLFFAKDIFLRKDIGLELIQALQNNYTSIAWPLKVEKQNALPGDKPWHRNNSIYVTTEENFLQSRWRRTDDTLESVTLIADNISSRCSFDAGPTGGSRLYLAQGIRSTYKLGGVHMTIEHPLNHSVYSEIVSCLANFSLITEASYGYITYSHWDGEPWRPWRYLHDVYGVTYLGPDIISLIGEDKVMSAPVAKNETLSDGGRILQLKPSLTESIDLENRAERDRIVEHLGREWFRDRDDPLWYLPLRNLVIPEELKDLKNLH